MPIRLAESMSVDLKKKKVSMDIATPFHIFIFLYQRKKETRDKTNARLQILIFVSYFYSSFIHFLRITLQTPFIFL